MKSFLNYSGKGGVGKSTLTYCMYLAFKAMGKSVLVLDMDLNTPSMKVLMGNDSPDLVQSDYTGVFVDSPTINLFVRSAVSRIKKEDPEILLIDTPPSITDVHRAIIQKLNISAVVLVSQPTELSKSDVIRTIPFFEKESITVTGIVENMSSGEKMDYGNYVKLLTIKKIKTLDSHKVYEAHEAEFAQFAENLLAMDLAEVSQENKVRAIFDESITWGDVKRMYHFYSTDNVPEDEEYEWEMDSRRQKLSDVRFVNLATWKNLYAFIDDKISYGNGMLRNTNPFQRLTSPVQEATYERVERLVRAFEKEETALFMVTKVPCTTVKIVAGEIGTCTLKIDDKFHGIPCVEYQTEQGVVRMFPHEVMPVDESGMKFAVRDGYQYNKANNRFIPPLEVCYECGYTFGARVGMPDNEEDIKTHWEAAMGLTAAPIPQLLK